MQHIAYFEAFFHSVSVQLSGDASGMGDQAGMGFHGSIAALVVGEGAWLGVGLGGAAGLRCITLVGAGDGVAVMLTGPGTMSEVFSIAMTGFPAFAAGVADGDTAGAVAGWFWLISSSTTKDDSRRIVMARALRSMITPTAIIILSYIYKMLCIKTIKR